MLENRSEQLAWTKLKPNHLQMNVSFQFNDTRLLNAANSESAPDTAKYSDFFAAPVPGLTWSNVSITKVEEDNLPRPVFDFMSYPIRHESTARNLAGMVMYDSVQSLSEWLRDRDLADVRPAWSMLAIKTYGFDGIVSGARNYETHNLLAFFAFINAVEPLDFYHDGLIEPSQTD